MTDIGFVPYPSAEAAADWFQKYAADAAAALRKLGRRADLQMWITTDSFDDVLAFYRRLGQEQRRFAESFLPNLREKSGYSVEAAHVIFDGETSPVGSKDYVSIQRPVIVSFEPLVVHEFTQIARYLVKE
jgi:hypothetical protein